MSAAIAREASGRALGVDVGGSTIKWALLVDGTVVATDKVPTPEGGPELVVEEVGALYYQAAPLDALGVAVPAVVDPVIGVVSIVPNLPGDWSGFPLGAALEARVRQHVVLVNDARSFALAELRLGAGRGCCNAIFITLGTGVGGALAVHGQLYLGSNGKAGEFGHQTIDPDGLPCGCGNRGCIETVASAPAVVAATVRGLRQGKPSVLRSMWHEGERPLSAADVASASAEGDVLAGEVMARAANGLGVGLANLSVVLAPDRVVIGGGFGQALRVLLEPLEQVLAEHVRLWPPSPVVGNALGLYAGAVGAALWALESNDEDHRVWEQKKDLPVQGNTLTRAQPNG